MYVMIVWRYDKVKYGKLTIIHVLQGELYLIMKTITLLLCRKMESGESLLSLLKKYFSVSEKKV